MTATEIITIIGAVTAAIIAVAGALGSLIVSVITANRTSVKLDQAAIQRNNSDAKLDTIHALTNANLAAVKTELSAAAGKNDILLERVASLEKRLIEKDISSTVAASTAAAAAVAIAAIKADVSKEGG